MSKIWYASSGKWFKEEGEPMFFRPQDFYWAVEIEKHWVEIKPEVHNLVKDTDKQFTSNSYVGLTKGDSWSSYTFLFWKIRSREERLGDKCPTLSNYLKQVPGLVSFSLSRLAPHTTIEPHRGDTNAVMRCHLGIEVPAGLPECGLQAGTEQQAWAEGKWLFFNDAFKHSAWNNTDKRRIVIIMDVIRPEFLYKERRVCANIRARHFVLQIQNRVKIIKYLKYAIKAPLFGIVYGITYIIHNQSL
jgi:aspartyl/asparaginyl beta-hydroxylase (cupin superfamily)